MNYELVKHPSQQEGVPTSAALLSQYVGFFEDVSQEAANTLRVDIELMRIHGIELNRSMFTAESDRREPKVVVVSVRNAISNITYHVLLGPYVVTVKMLNMNSKIFDRLTPIVASGSFGAIIPLVDEQEQFVAKRIHFKRNLRVLEKSKHGADWILEARFLQVRPVIVECALTKIFSALKIGPKAKLDIGFDVVCYRDCAQFYMERCLPLTQRASESQLKYCIAVMHTHHFVHRDIKPANVVFSPSLNNYVMCDFGITTPMVSGPGTQTMAFCDGTLKYMSEELKRLPKQGGLVDLYCNDMHSLKLTLLEMKQLFASLRIRQPPVSTTTGPTQYIRQIKSISTFLSVQHCAPMTRIDLPQDSMLEFCVSSFDAWDVQQYLSSLEDGRADVLLKRAQATWRKPSEVRRQYEQFKHLRANVYPQKYLDIRVKELARLDASPFLTNKQIQDQGTLLADILELEVCEPTHADHALVLLDRFKLFRNLPGYKQLLRRFEIKLKVVSSQGRFDTEEIAELLDGCDNGTMIDVSILLRIKGDNQASVKALLCIHQPDEPQTYSIILRNIFKGYVGAWDEGVSLLNAAELEINTKQFSNEPFRWTWLRSLNLLLMALVGSNPGRCIELFHQYYPLVDEIHRYPIVCIAVFAYQELGIIDEAIKWQQRAVELAQASPQRCTALIDERDLLVRLKAISKSFDLRTLLKQMLEVIEDYERLRLPAQMIPAAWEFVAYLLIELGDSQKAERIFCEQEEQAIRLCSPDKLLQYYSIHMLSLSGKGLLMQNNDRLEKAEYLMKKALEIKLVNYQTKIELIGFFRNLCILLTELRVLRLPILLASISNKLATASRLSANHILGLLQSFIVHKGSVTSLQQSKLLVNWLINSITWIIVVQQRQLPNSSIRRFSTQRYPDTNQYLLIARLLKEGNHLKLYFGLVEQSPMCESLHYHLILAAVYHTDGRDEQAFLALIRQLENKKIQAFDKNENSVLWTLINRCIDNKESPQTTLPQLRKLFSTYSKLRLRSIGKYVSQLKSDFPIQAVELYTNVLLTLDRRLIALNQEEPKRGKRWHRAFRNDLHRRQVWFVERQIPQTAEIVMSLCEFWSVLHKFRKIAKAMSRLQCMGISAIQEDVLAQRMESEGLWLQLFVFFSRTSEKCPNELLLQLEKLADVSVPLQTILSGQIRAKIVVLAKSIRQKLLMGLRFGCRSPVTTNKLLQRLREVKLTAREK